MLRRRWKDLSVLVALFVLLCACLAWPSEGNPLVRGFVLGLCAGAVAALIAGLVLLLDGSLLRRIGRAVEADTGDLLRRVRGVYGVVSSLLFERFDVDHVVFSPTGIWVVEVKWSMTPAEDLEHVWGLQAHLDQALLAARKVGALVRTTAKDVPVRAVLVLAGPGMPLLGAQAVRDGVRVINPASRAEWARLLSDGAPAWTLEQARGAAAVVTDLQTARLNYERSRVRRSPG